MATDLLRLKQLIDEMVEQVGGEEAASNTKVAVMIQPGYPLLVDFDGAALKSELDFEEARREYQEEREAQEDLCAAERELAENLIPPAMPERPVDDEVVYLLGSEYPPSWSDSPYGDRHAWEVAKSNGWC